MAFMNKKIWAYGRFAVGSIAWLDLLGIIQPCGLNNTASSNGNKHRFDSRLLAPPFVCEICPTNWCRHRSLII